jgi:hypothetical protein
MRDPFASSWVDEAMGFDATTARNIVGQYSEALKAKPRVAIPAHHLVALFILRRLAL